MVGDTTSPGAQFVIEQTRMNDTLRETRSLATDAFGGMLNDLRQGNTLATTLANVTNRVADRLTNRAVDSVIAGLMGSGGTSGAGAAGGGITGFLASAKSFFGFSDGGYTGPGARYDVRGVVHAGEVVFSQDDVARFGGVGAVEAMRRGMRGYADGGVVGPGAFSPPRFSPPKFGGSADAMPSIVINNNGAPVQVQSAEMKSDGAGGRRLEVTVEELVAKKLNSPRGQAAMMQGYGVRPRLARV